MCSRESVKQQVKSLWVVVRNVDVSTVFHACAFVSNKRFLSNLTVIRNMHNFCSI
jgi:hypothetical protein